MSSEPHHTPPRRAVALEYDSSSSPAPVVSASGQGHQAEQIIRLAREAGVPIVEDPNLAGVLAALDVGQAIPEELYVAVAEVLAYLYRLSHQEAPSQQSAAPPGNRPLPDGSAYSILAERDGKHSQTSGF